MKTNNALLQKARKETSGILEEAEKTLPAIIINSTGHLVKRLTRKEDPLPWGYSLIVLALLIQLPTLLLVALLGESSQWTYLINPDITWGTLGLIWMVYIELGLFATTIARVGVYYLFRNIKKHILYKIRTADDLRDLQDVLREASSNRKAIIVTLSFTFFWCISFSLVFSFVIKGFIGFGLLIGTVIFGLLTGPALYMEAWFFFFITKIGKYNYFINATSPAHSEVIVELSRIITSLLYSFAIFIAFATLSVAYNIGAILLVALIGWIPTIIYFIGGQRALSRIIISAKWKTLNRIQGKIISLNNGNLTNKSKIETINRLMDYHERIRITPNSTFNIATGFSLFNQLALPLTALILANADKIFSFLK